MALTDTDYKLMIVNEVNDSEDGVIQDSIDQYWGMYVGHTDLFQRYLYTKRHAIVRLLGAERRQVTTEIKGGAVEIDKNAFTDHLNNLLKWTQAQIDEFESTTVLLSGAGGWGRTPERA